jgi:hypothetical protein
VRDLDRSALSEHQRRMRSGKQVYRLQRVARKARIVGLNHAKQILAKVNLATLEHSEGVGPRNCLDHLDLHVGVTLRESVQEPGKGAFDELRGGRYLQYAPVAAPKLLRALADRAGAVQQTTAVAKQLLALASQHETASYTIEEFKTELLLKIADLPGQGRLSNVQTCRCLGDGAQVCNGDEGSRVSKVHTSSYA